ncbi:MAG: sigma-70 family RNA polymerase sigma factor [Bacteroidales bacterium]
MEARRLKSLPEEVLVARFCAEGSREYLSELFLRYRYLVYGVCLKYLNDREAAKDSVMQIFEKLLVSLRGQEVRNFGSWLYVMSKNHCLMQLRSEKAFRERNRKWTEEQEKIVESEFSLHPFNNNDPELVRRLAECIEKLREEQKLCIRLFYYEDLCYREIAEKTQTDENKVKSSLQNGKRNLKLCLESNHD